MQRKEARKQISEYDLYYYQNSNAFRQVLRTTEINSRELNFRVLHFQII